MNQRQSKSFYQELINSNYFHKKQKRYITEIFNKYQTEIKSKIRLSMNLSCNVGRPEKLKNILNFNLMCNYYKTGYISLKGIMKMFDIKYKSSFYRYYEKYYKELKLDTKVSKEFTREHLEEVFNKYAYGYAEKYANKIFSKKEEYKQEALTRMWTSLLNYDESISIRALFNNICYNLLEKYFNDFLKEKKIIRYEDYAYEDSDRNKLDKYFSE